MSTITLIDKNTIKLTDFELFDLTKTFECGQCFRWDNIQKNLWKGVVQGKEIFVEEKDESLLFYPVSEDEFKKFWIHYFDLERNYKQINKELYKDSILKKAGKYGEGIRILNQDPWEALCSFIISQNNNIPRIKGIIQRLCENFGKKIDTSYSFPSAEVLSKLTLEDLSILRSGFRAKYILDAAKKVASGEIDLEEIKSMDSDTARDILTSIYGVGAKVADCTLLFGMGHIDVCPKDVWITRALQVFYGGDFPDCAKDYAGIAQQYLFYYARETKLKI